MRRTRTWALGRERERERELRRAEEERLAPRRARQAAGAARESQQRQARIEAEDAAIKPRLMHQQRLDGRPDDLVAVTKRGEIRPATARERQVNLFE